jgi:hypothetical protein
MVVAVMVLLMRMIIMLLLLLLLLLLLIMAMIVITTTMETRSSHTHDSTERPEGKKQVGGCPARNPAAILHLHRLRMHHFALMPDKLCHAIKHRTNYVMQ